MNTNGRWLILNTRRGVWWRANQAGYTEDVLEAGRYGDEEALQIVERMNYQPDGGDPVKLVPANEHWLQ